MGLQEKTFSQIVDLISHGRAPLTVVVGPSGSGKTTFLINLAKRITIPWYLFYNAVRASEYSSLESGMAIVSGDCLMKNPYECFKYLKTDKAGLAAAAEAIACEILRQKGLAVAQQCEDIQVNSSVLEWAKLELRPMHNWIDSVCRLRSGKIEYRSHVDLLRIPLIRCCSDNIFDVIIDDIQQIPRIDFVGLIKSLRDTASVVAAVHPDQSLEREVATMVSSAYIMCLTPRERWSATQLEYWRQLMKKSVGYKLEPVMGAYNCMVLQKEVKVKVPNK